MSSATSPSQQRSADKSKCLGSGEAPPPRVALAPAWAHPALTLGWEGPDPQLPSLVAHPLRAALARDLNPPGMRTVPAGQPNVLAAQGHTGEAPVLTLAANPAVGLEGLPIPVQAAVHLTAPVILSPCRGETRPPSMTPQLFPGQDPASRIVYPVSLQSWPRCCWGPGPFGICSLPRRSSRSPSPASPGARGKTVWCTASWHRRCGDTGLVGAPTLLFISYGAWPSDFTSSYLGFLI